MKNIVSIADAVVAEINAGTFSQTFTAKRTLLPIFELKDLATLKVTVVPSSLALSALSRADSLNEIGIDVAVQKQIDVTTETDAEALIRLVTEIVGHLRNRALATEPTVMWMKTEVKSIYSPEHMSDNKTFTSVITVTYKAAG